MSLNGETLFKKIILLIILVAAVEIIFFKFDGLLFGSIISALAIYYGVSRYHKFHGKLFFWFGILGIVISLMSLFVIRLILFLAILYALYKYLNNSKNPVHIDPFQQQTSAGEAGNPLPVKPVIENRLFGNQRTMETAYEWNDIDVVSGFGDIVIDLSNTILPAEASVIVIRNMVGNVEILIPHDVGIKVTHNALFGTATFLGADEKKIRNQQVTFQSTTYRDSTYKVKIVTSLGFGNIKVRWI